MTLESELQTLGLLQTREADGTGNNLVHDTWGSAGETLVRITQPAYADQVSDPYDRGNAREISNAMADVPGGTTNSFNTSELFIFFGQYIDHDIDIVFEDPTAGQITTVVPDDDPAFTPGAHLDLERSKYQSGTGTGDIPREHINEITSFLDASNVYGSSQATTNVLRDGAYMIANSNGGAAGVSDIEAVHGVGSAAGLYTGDPTHAHVMGDIRSDENIALTSMHEIWMKEHNYQVDRLKAMNLGLSDDQLFNVARAIVEAEYQKVIYDEWLPQLIGDTLPEYQGYKHDVNPTISNEFAGAAFRFGHTMLPTEFERLSEDGTVTDSLGLFQAFFQPHKLDLAGGVAGLVRGLASDTASELDGKIIDDIRNLLFGPDTFRDLASLNIMRGRDHGIGTINEVRSDLGLNPALQPYTSFDQLTSDSELADALSIAYGGDINKVDLWVGLLVEDKVDGLQVGETLQAILIDQFSRLRDGDRFYYENRLADSPELLHLIEESSFSDIVKRSTGIEYLQEEVFKSYERLVGDDGDNSIFGGDGSELIVGMGGNDTLHGGGSRDEMYGGDGNDDMFGDDGHDIMYGEDGDDFLLTGSGNDHAEGGKGNDTIYLGDGYDYAQGEQGDDEIRGGNHDDIIGGGDGADSLHGDDGNDRIYGDAGNDYILGGYGNDFLRGGYDHDMLYGDQGNDRIYGDHGNDIISGGSSNDVMVGGSGYDKMYGGLGSDKMHGGDHNDRMYGGDQGDRMYGDNGNDWMFGQNGADVMVGGKGHDKMYGGNHNDKMHGGAHNDTMYGGNQNDRMYGDDGNDWMYGQNGADVMIGGRGFDKMFGGASNDRMYGGAHNDKMFGESGDDWMYGQSGADLIDGGTGNDRLWGGQGADKFIMGKGMGYDRIYDFNVNSDKLVVGAHFNSTKEVLQHAYSTSQGTLIEFSNTEKVFLLGVSKYDLDSSNFGFDYH